VSRHQGQSKLRLHPLPITLYYINKKEKKRYTKLGDIEQVLAKVQGFTT
jgi:hypothetical protein